MTPTPLNGLSAPHQKINILLVDDQVRNLEVLESLLQSEDYRLVQATSGAEALLALMKDDFAVIVLDIQMPELNGIELARLTSGGSATSISRFFFSRLTSRRTPRFWRATRWARWIT